MSQTRADLEMIGHTEIAIDNFAGAGQGQDVARHPRRSDHGDRESQLARAKMHYRACVSANHPDKGGSDEKMAEFNKPWEQAQKELGDG